MTKSHESAPAQPRAAEAKEDPHAKAFIANARRIADERAEDTKEALKIQERYDRVQDEMRRGAAKTRAEAD